MDIRLRRGVVGSAGIFGAALGWLLSFKILAFFLGPEGVGLFGQLRQIVQTATLVATYGGTNVLVQGLASQRDDDARARLRAAVYKFFGLTGLVVVLPMLVFAQQLVQLAFSSSSPELVSAVRWLALAVLLSAVTSYCVALLNAYNSHTYMAVAQSAGPILLPLFIWANLSDVPVDAESLAMALFFCFGVGSLAGVWGKRRLHLTEIDASDTSMPAQELTEFRRFALFNLLAVVSSVVALLIVRSWIIEANGLEFAGLFEAGWTLSFNYTTLFLTACNTFYLPMLAGANGGERQRACILRVAYGVLGVSVLACYAMMVWQGALIHLFYSHRFESSGEVFSILVVTVMLRGVSWVYGTLLVATRRAKVLLVSDLTMNLVLLVCVRYALDTQASLESLGWAFFVPHLLYLVFIVEFVRKTNPMMRRRHIWPLLLVAVAPLLFLAVSPDGLRWSSTAYSRAIIGAFCLVLCGVIYRVFRKVAA